MMNQDSGSSAEIHRCLTRLRSGDLSARQDLISAAQNRLIRLSRKMLSDFPGVHRWEDTDDIFQNAAIRLYRSLERVVPDSVSAFVQLAARDIRCTLIDLARRYYGPQGHGTHHLTGSHSGRSSPVTDATDNTNDPARLTFWTEFHQQVQLMPDELRAVMDIVWYQGMSHAEAAALLGISERTVQRRWRQACLHLHDVLKGLPPGIQ